MQTEDTTLHTGSDIFQVLHRIKLNTDAKLALLEDAARQVLREHEIQTRVALQAAGRVG